MELITRQSGLLKAITYTIRVMVSSVYFISGKYFILRISAIIPVDGPGLSRQKKFVKVHSLDRYAGFVSS